jgi:hypothetical protein
MASKGRKGKKRAKVPARKKGKARVVWIAVVLVLAGGLAAAGLLYFRGTKHPATSKALTAGPGKAGAKAVSQGSSAHFRPLIGRWVRPDGGYVIEILSIDASGKMDARYYNPRPIHVARAEASKVAGRIEVFVELRDTGYPGATYNLVYNSEKNLLAGLYYQPAAGQNFSVVFVPMKQG